MCWHIWVIWSIWVKWDTWCIWAIYYILRYMSYMICWSEVGHLVYMGYIVSCRVYWVYVLYGVWESSGTLDIYELYGSHWVLSVHCRWFPVDFSSSTLAIHVVLLHMWVFTPGCKMGRILKDSSASMSADCWRLLSVWGPQFFDDNSLCLMIRNIYKHSLYYIYPLYNLRSCFHNFIDLNCF